MNFYIESVNSLKVNCIALLQRVDWSLVEKYLASYSKRSDIDFFLKWNEWQRAKLQPDLICLVLSNLVVPYLGGKIHYL